MTASLSTSHRPGEVRSADHRTLERAGLHPLPQLPARPPLHLVSPEGQLQVHTAPYRGSFASVLSQALRAAGLGSRVMVVQFLKGGVAQGPDRRLTLCGRLQWLRPDVACCLAEPASEQEPDTLAAVQALWAECRSQLLNGELDQLVMDELGLAVALGYLDEQDVRSTLEQRPGSMDVIVTGPAIPDSLMDMADQVTELRRGF
ncbi:cob(I)yrinic acid a,c-diamide adenosyltransferase [Synechococcus sp. RS9916]|uniref:cob(I)yrinic acid a,c-diamide adenosyltransferase n=1 Tax=Synechococcus sp. RS9916 TaxID=221359 RepID=UPI0000E54765|nr:cob(I)yrinic acid a,c-diamide adenosyltransferase [Synechococcus sp. RS9916]EAU72699.1 cob(I)alamin adenosyltransferase [Synechococcus sp. RS9916]